MTEEQKSEAELTAETLIGQLWDHFSSDWPESEREDLPQLGIITTVINHEPTGRRFRISVYETNDEEEAELGLDQEDQLKLILLRTSRIVRELGGLSDLVARMGTVPMKVGIIPPGSDLIDRLASMMNPDVPPRRRRVDPDEIVIGPTVPLDGLLLNGPDFDGSDLRPLTEIYCSYGHMVEKLGMPVQLPSDPTRMDVQWTLEWEGGARVSIANLDDGPVTLGASGPSLEELNHWFVYGNPPDADSEATLAEVLRDMLGLIPGPSL